MILTLGILFVGLGVAAWIYSMYLSWQAQNGATFDPATATPLMVTTDKVVRYLRRFWYLSQAKIRVVLRWFGAKAQKQLITWFPASRAMFERHDKLAGLDHGPTSYFLKRISPTDKSPKTRLPRSKKML